MKNEEEEAGGRIASLLLRAFQAKHLKSVEAFVLLFAVLFVVWLERLFIPPVPFVLHFFLSWALLYQVQTSAENSKKNGE